MTVEEEVKAVEKKRNVIVGIRMDSQSRQLLNWALVKVAEQGDCVVAVHVCRSSDLALKDKPLLDSYLEVYEGLCNVKQVNLTGKILIGSSIRKVLVKEAKNCGSMAVIVGINKPNGLGSWASVARYCAKQLPPSTETIAIHNGKVIFRRGSSNRLPGMKGDPRPSLYLFGNPKFKESQSEFGDSEAESEKSRSEYRLSIGSEDPKDDFSLVHTRKKFSRRSISLFAGDPSEQRPGWPLLRRASSAIPQAVEARKLSVVQWVMSLPNRSPPQTLQSLVERGNPLGREINSFVGRSNRNSPFAQRRILLNELELLLKTNTSGCRWFTYEVLKNSTSQFSSENLIGKGGCNRVYKGILPDGKPVAVKILKSSKEAWKDFMLEVNIISSLKHKHIMPLLGVCIENNDLISVYDFLSKGSLEENLHGSKKDKIVLSWEVRFKVAVGVAEALNYLHNECTPPVIHRDVKSSNILLSDGFEPQLSDFGLAIWGPTTSSFLTQCEVVGTFGYLAPEYFMYGRVSDKIDVYSFGVVLLELLSGRKPICSETPKGQESLVMWAKPIIESGDLKGILDSNLDGNFDEVQMQRMVLAATLCITRAARLRPKMIQILKLLRGEEDVEKWINSQIDGPDDLENQNDNDDEVYPESCTKSHLGLALLDVDDDSTSFSSVEQSNSLSIEEYLKGRWSRSSSLD
ncbi:hypothetical protein L1049_014901 [Liquidambar formosana]|uniref:Protein kinase domain-containing protein n=1 Tax=Liquidambar formosana TaxID=63359 RepID=A0AAP0RWS4_LIQFO